MNFYEFREDLSNKRKTRDALDREFQKERETLRTLEARKARLKRLRLEDSDEFQRIVQQEAELRQKLPELQDELKRAEASMDNLIVSFAELETPQEAVEHLDDRIPFLLLPVRLETRFKQVLSTDTGASEAQLWLRIFPDDIHVETHEKILTEDEVVAAQAYWTEIWRAGGDPERELGAWRVLMREYGSQRAAWIVRTYEPNNEFDDNGNSNRPPSPLEEDEELAPAPTFDPYEPKQESWSLPPRVTTLPDRFVAMGFIDGEKVMDYKGNPIPSSLIAGPNPSHPADENEGFKEDDEELEVDAEMKWIVDFDEAVRVGMGMKIPLNEQTAEGFDRLIVLGLRLSADETGAQELLQALIESHHYSEDGFSIVPQGTATNNTRSGGAGFKSFDLGDDESFNVERGDPLFKEEFGWERKRDGQYLAEALGIDLSVLQHIQFSDGLDQGDARAMNTALWPATLGYFLEEMMDPIFPKDTVEQIREFFLQHVTGRGPVPAIRVGTQPYGILPTSSFERWRYPSGDDIVVVTDHSGFSSSFGQKLYDFLMRMDQQWDEMVKNVSHAGKEGDSQQNLLDVLGLHAGSAEYYNRFAVSLEEVSNLLKIKGYTWASLDLATLINAVWSGIIYEFGVEGDELPDILNSLPDTFFDLMKTKRDSGFVTR